MINVSPTAETSFFRLRNTHPEGVLETGFAASAVNAVSIATGRDWVSVFHELLDQVHTLGLMPEDFKCAKGLLAANGFIHQPGANIPKITVEALREQMSAQCTSGVTAIVRSELDGYGGEMFVLHTATVSGKQTYLSVGREDPRRLLVREIWLKWPDGQDHSPIRRQKRNTSPRERSPKTSHGSFRFRQENPHNIFTGDCVVRGISAVCDLTWDETVDLLGQYNRIAINARSIFSSFLEARGFIRCPPLRKNNRCLTAAEFCDAAARQYRNGERILAHVGNAHVAAVMPIAQPGGTYRYEVCDTWDCTQKPITYYWVQPPTVSRKVGGNPNRELPLPFTAGESIHHPIFGSGKILSLFDAGKQTFLEVDFPGVGKKRLAGNWASAHCRKLHSA